MKNGLSAAASLKTYGFMAGGFALVATVVGAFTAGPAIAQAVRAALVSNVDDPGRIPYAGALSCSFDNSVLCLVPIPPVPNGKRLVITHVSGFVQENLPGGTFLRLSLAGSYNDAYLVPTYNGSQDGLNSFVFDRSVLLFVDPGIGPQAAVRLGDVPSSTSSASFNLSGYMLDCSNGTCAKISR